MEVNRAGSSRDGGGGSDESGNPSGSLIDRGNMRILLCDKDLDSCQSVMNLLCKCSYQVTSVRSARQVVDALNVDGPDIDIILMEADLPMAKGMKLLKRITRDENLQRIPVIMMSAVDDVSLVFKSLRLGAADFLVKPLRTNELLNLWTHMWRRRRMLGLEEKRILSSDGNLIDSDLSNDDTNSTTLFSEGTDGKVCRNTDPENSIQDYDTYFAAEISSAVAFITRDAPSIIDKSVNLTTLQSGDIFSSRVEDTYNRTGLSFSCPKKSELKIGNSSAFCTYTRTCSNDDLTLKLNMGERDGSVANDRSESFPESSSLERASTPPDVSEHPHRHDTAVDQLLERSKCHPNEQQMTMSRFNSHSAYPFFPPGMSNHMMIPYYPQFNQSFVQYPPYMPPVLVPFSSQYPTSQMPNTTNPLPGAVTNHHQPTADAPNYITKREAALLKFKRKRNERSFDKKIRYINRKNLAESRPRVKGQFISKVAVAASAGDTNGLSTPQNYEAEDEDEDGGQDRDPEMHDCLAQNNHSDQF